MVRHHQRRSRHHHGRSQEVESFMNEWKNGILNPEAPSLVKSMVKQAQTLLEGDINYDSYRDSLANIHSDRDTLKVFRKVPKQIMSTLQSFSNDSFEIKSETWASEADSSYIDRWIKELMRFLAMKLIIVGEPIPSSCIRDAWQALILFPATYEKVCKAMGSSSPIETYVSSSTNVELMSLDWYAFTLDSYEVLFKKEAPEKFWPFKDQNLVPGATSIVHVPGRDEELSDEIDSSGDESSLTNGRSGVDEKRKYNSPGTKIKERDLSINETNLAEKNFASKEKDLDKTKLLLLTNDWTLLVQQPEAAALVKKSVLEARVVLEADSNYKFYRLSLSHMLEARLGLKKFVLRRVHEAISTLANNNSERTKDGDDVAAEIQLLLSPDSSFIDDWIDQVLFFLAMKVLIVKGPVPSTCVRDAWQALTILRTTYGKVCKAMDSPNAVDLESENDFKAHKKELYLLTIMSFEVLYEEEAPATFWPKPIDVDDMEIGDDSTNAQKTCTESKAEPKSMNNAGANETKAEPTRELIFCANNEADGKARNDDYGIGPDEVRGHYYSSTTFSPTNIYARAVDEARETANIAGTPTNAQAPASKVQSANSIPSIPERMIDIERKNRSILRTKLRELEDASFIAASAKDDVVADKMGVEVNKESALALAESMFDMIYEAAAEGYTFWARKIV